MRKERFMLAWRFVTFMWPFLRELVIGKKTIAEAAKSHTGRLILLIFILSSFGLNGWAVPKVIAISKKYLTLEKSYNKLSEESSKQAPSVQEINALKEEIEKLRKENSLVENVGKLAVPINKPTEPEDNVKWARAQMDAIREREAQEFNKQR